MTVISKNRLQKLAGILHENTDDNSSNINSIDGVKVFDVIDNIMLINVSDLLDVIMPSKTYLTPYEETSEAVKNWVKEHDAHYYSWEGERHEIAYYTGKAVEEAEKEDKNIVVMDYLS